MLEQVQQLKLYSFPEAAKPRASDRKDDSNRRKQRVPLTDVPQDSEADAAITPNDILLGSSSGVKATRDDADEDLTAFLSERDEDIHRFWTRTRRGSIDR